jgi:hypothetical protein
VRVCVGGAHRGCRFSGRQHGRRGRRRRSRRARLSGRRLRLLLRVRRRGSGSRGRARRHGLCCGRIPRGGVRGCGRRGHAAARGRRGRRILLQQRVPVVLLRNNRRSARRRRRQRRWHTLSACRCQRTSLLHAARRTRRPCALRQRPRRCSVSQLVLHFARTCAAAASSAARAAAREARQRCFGAAAEMRPLRRRGGEAATRRRRRQRAARTRPSGPPARVLHGVSGPAGGTALVRICDAHNAPLCVRVCARLLQQRLRLAQPVAEPRRHGAGRRRGAGPAPKTPSRWWELWRFFLCGTCWSPRVGV